METKRSWCCACWNHQISSLEGGGTVFGPNPHKYRHKVSKKLSILARKSVFLDKLLNGKVVLLDKLAMENGKTSSFNNRLSSFGLKNKKVTFISIRL